jgi:hypothetical protein
MINISTLKDLRCSFWTSNPQLKRHGRRKQNDYPVDIRMAWCDFVESTRRAGDISERLAEKATL